MKSKRWLCIFLVLFFVGIGGYMAVNYYVDPLGYFIVDKGERYYNSGDYTRAIKAKYVSANSDQIDAVVLGGSKSGVLSTELLSEYTGKKYYNFYMNKGNFSDFLTYAEYLIKDIQVSEITLHISSFEVEYYSAGTANILAVPAIVSGNLWDTITEYCSYLLLDTNTLYERRNVRNNPDYQDNLTNGQRNRTSSYQRLLEDPEGYIAQYVTKNFEKNMEKLFRQTASGNPAFDDNLNALRKIKALCEENNVTLKVVIGASFIGERYTYECDRYYDYLHELVTITDVWDFSDFNAINQNPYNFVGTQHYSDSVGDLMIRTMYGQASEEDFGVYLTKDNIEEYLTKRKEKKNQLQQEFEATGTIALPGMEDASYLPVPNV